MAGGKLKYGNTEFRFKAMFQQRWQVLPSLYYAVMCDIAGGSTESCW